MLIAAVGFLQVNFQGGDHRVHGHGIGLHDRIGHGRVVSAGARTAQCVPNHTPSEQQEEVVHELTSSCAGGFLGSGSLLHVLLTFGLALALGRGEAGVPRKLQLVRPQTVCKKLPGGQLYLVWPSAYCNLR